MRRKSRPRLLRLLSMRPGYVPVDDLRPPHPHSPDSRKRPGTDRFIAAVKNKGIQQEATLKAIHPSLPILGKCIYLFPLHR